MQVSEESVPQIVSLLLTFALNKVLLDLQPFTRCFSDIRYARTGTKLNVAFANVTVKVYSKSPNMGLIGSVTKFMRWGGVTIL